MISQLKYDEKKHSNIRFIPDSLQLLNFYIMEHNTLGSVIVTYIFIECSNVASVPVRLSRVAVATIATATHGSVPTFDGNKCTLVTNRAILTFQYSIIKLFGNVNLPYIFFTDLVSVTTITLL